MVVATGSNRDTILSAMGRWSIQPLTCSALHDARRLLPLQGPSLVFCEETLADGTYRDLLRDLARWPRVYLAVISGRSDLDQVHRKASALGAFETIASPCKPADVQWVAIRVLQTTQRRARRKRPRDIPLPQPSSPAAPGA